MTTLTKRDKTICRGQVLSEHDHAQAIKRGISGQPFTRIEAASYADALTMTNTPCPTCGRKD